MASTVRRFLFLYPVFLGQSLAVPDLTRRVWEHRRPTGPVTFREASVGGQPCVGRVLANAAPLLKPKGGWFVWEVVELSCLGTGPKTT